MKPPCWCCGSRLIQSAFTPTTGWVWVVTAGLVFPFVQSSLARARVSQVGSDAWQCNAITFIINYLRGTSRRIAVWSLSYIDIYSEITLHYGAQVDVGNVPVLPVKLALQRQKKTCTFGNRTVCGPCTQCWACDGERRKQNEQWTGGCSSRNRIVVREASSAWRVSSGTPHLCTRPAKSDGECSEKCRSEFEWRSPPILFSAVLLHCFSTVSRHHQY